MSNEFDSEMEQQMMESMEHSPAPSTTPKAESWKDKLARIKAAQPSSIKPEGNGSVIPPAGNSQPPHPQAHLIMKGDMGTPQNLLEADIEADRIVGRKAESDALEKETERILNGEAIYIETMAANSYDKDRFYRIFVDVINQKFLGKNLDETEQIIQDMHQALFDLRTGIQAGMKFREQLLKDEDADKRAERLKKDWLFKPKSASKEKKASSPKSEKKPAKTMFETMRDSMMALKGISKEEAETKLKAKGFMP